MSAASEKDTWWKIALAIGGFVASTLGVYATFNYNRQSERDHELQWRPVLNVVVRKGALGDREPLGIFLENVGKGPARVNAFRAASDFPQVDISGVRETLGSAHAGTLLAAGETIPLLAFTPEPGKSWDPRSIDQVFATIAQFQQHHAALAICYGSFFRGCHRVTRALDASGEWTGDIIDQACDAPCRLPGENAAP